MGVKNFSHTYRSTMCGLKKLASGVFPESWKVLAERRRQRRRKRAKNNKSPGYPGWLNNQFRNLQAEIYFEAIRIARDQSPHQKCAGYAPSPCQTRRTASYAPCSCMVGTMHGFGTDLVRNPAIWLVESWN